MFRYVPEINMFLCLPFQNDNKTKHQSQGSNDKVFRLQKLAVAKPAEAFCEWSSDFYMCKTFPQGLIKMSCHTVLHTRILSKSFNGCQFCLFQSPLKQCSMTYYQLRSEETNVHIVIYYALCLFVFCFINPTIILSPPFVTIMRKDINVIISLTGRKCQALYVLLQK